jgi:hypothetical protein
MNPSSPQVPCLVRTTALALRLVRGRKSGKPFLMLVCPVDGRHFRGFITHRDYVAGVLARLESQTASSTSGGDAGGELNSPEDIPSKTNLERDHG